MTSFSMFFLFLFLWSLELDFKNVLEFLCLQTFDAADFCFLGVEIDRLFTFAHFCSNIFMTFFSGLALLYVLGAFSKSFLDYVGTRNVILSGGSLEFAMGSP